MGIVVCILLVVAYAWSAANLARLGWPPKPAAASPARSSSDAPRIDVVPPPRESSLGRALAALRFWGGHGSTS